MLLFRFATPFKSNVIMIRKYHNHTLQTNQQHREEEPQNICSNIITSKQHLACNTFFELVIHFNFSGDNDM